MKQYCTGYAGFHFARPTEEPHPSVQFSFLRSLFITTHSFPVEAPESQLISWVTLQIDNDKGCDGFIVDALPPWFQMVDALPPWFINGRQLPTFVVASSR